MKAWIENNRVRDIAQGNPQENYHPDVAKLYDTEVPNGTVSGATLVNGVWPNPPPPPPPTAAELAAEAARQAAIAAAALEVERLAFNATVHADIATIELKQHRATREHILAPNAVDPVTTRTPAQQIEFLSEQIVTLRGTLK